MKRAVLPLLLLISFQMSFGQVTSHTTGEDTLAKNLLQRNGFKTSRLYNPLSLIVAGASLGSSHPESIKNEIVEERNEHWGNFNTHIDDYLQFSPIAVAYGLDAFGVRSKTDLANRTAILIKGELSMLAVTHLLKKATHVQRPDFSNYSSFPSGHTAQAFAAATFLSEEYKDRLPWIPYVSYGIAASVGALRMANNKHFVSDVLAGAGIGILCVKFSYWTHRYKWNRKKAYSLH